MESVKNRLKQVVADSLPDGITFESTLSEFKKALDDAIIKAGEKGKESIIRSQEPIKLFHELVKAELIRHSIPADLINPPLGKSAGELNLSGYFKNKNQDVCVSPRNQQMQAETINTGMLKGFTDTYGKTYTERTLVVNVRSQMSSIAKNLDTMYERIFAEPLNLHMRCPEIVIGELYVIPITGYDMKFVKKNIPKFESVITQPKNKRTKTTAQVVEQYILAFQTVNQRNKDLGEEYKYERVCLLIVDFSRNPIKVYNSDTELKADGLLPQTSATTFAGLDFTNFIPDLLQIHRTRFGKGIFI